MIAPTDIFAGPDGQKLGRLIACAMDLEEAAGQPEALIAALEYGSTAFPPGSTRRRALLRFGAEMRRQGV